MTSAICMGTCSSPSLLRCLRGALQEAACHLPECVDQQDVSAGPINHHPVLGVEYQQNEFSLTDQYFEKMGLQVRFFMPPNSVAPLAFYFLGDLLGDYTNLELISTISTMETFQRIYRPEIYNANSAAGEVAISPA